MDRRDFLEKAAAISGAAASALTLGKTVSARGEAVHSRVIIVQTDEQGGSSHAACAHGAGRVYGKV